MNAVGSSPKNRLVARARELGFDSCRIAKATASFHAAEFRAWLDDGAAGDMQWMGRGGEKSCYPQQILPGARSIVLVALNYWQGSESALKERPFTNRRQTDGGVDTAAPCGSGSREAVKGKVARYAWGDDYHDLMLAKLEK